VTSAEYAIAGVVVGAVASGGVQATIASLDRRRAGRAAARLLFMQLQDARKAVADLRVRRDWQMMLTDWPAYDVAWREHSKELALALNDTYDFHHVSTAFACLRSIAGARDLDLKMEMAIGEAGFDPSDDTLDGYGRQIARAQEVLLHASFRFWEIRNRRRALAGLKREGRLRAN
jgi:hypothetical protein